MPMTKSRSSLCSVLLVAAAAVATLPATISAVSFHFNTASSCRNNNNGDGGGGDPFTNVNITVSCGVNNNNTTSSKCLFGDVASITGTVEATRTFDNSELTYKACVWKYCPQSTTRSAGTLCDDWLIPIEEDQACGDAGLYSISRTETIPEADISNSLSWLVTLNVGITETTTTTCNHTNTRANNNVVTEASQSFGSTGPEKSKSVGGGGVGDEGSFMSYSLMGAIFGTAFGTVLATRKRCNEPEEYDEDELFAEERPFSFTELQDVACNA